jgi:hypothetical protein
VEKIMWAQYHNLERYFEDFYQLEDKLHEVVPQAFDTQGYYLREEWRKWVNDYLEDKIESAMRIPKRWSNAYEEWTVLHDYRKWKWLAGAWLKFGWFCFERMKSICFRNYIIRTKWWPKGYRRMLRDSLNSGMEVIGFVREMSPCVTFSKKAHDVKPIRIDVLDWLENFDRFQIGFEGKF